ncbi:hypothetical protein ACFL6G_05020 [candidate division KSB1 bacterium]
MKVKTILIIGILIFVYSNTGAQIFDGNRKGFVLGMGGGAGMVSADQNIVGTEDLTNQDERSMKSFCWGGVVGWGITERIQIFNNGVVFFPRNYILDPSTISTLMIGGWGVRYYLSDSPASNSVMAGYGFFTNWNIGNIPKSIGMSSTASMISAEGGSFFIGYSHALTKHSYLELMVTFGDLDDPGFSSVFDGPQINSYNSKLKTISLTINVLAF